MSANEEIAAVGPPFAAYPRSPPTPVPPTLVATADRDRITFHADRDATDDWLTVATEWITVDADVVVEVER